MIDSVDILVNHSTDSDDNAESYLVNSALSRVFSPEFYSFEI